MESSVNNLIVLLVIIPMVAAIATVALRGYVKLQRLAGCAALIASLGAALYFIMALPSGDAVLLTNLGGWPAPFGITVVFDGLSGPLLVVTQLVALACYMHAFSVLNPRHERGWFHPLFHLLIMGVNFSFLTGDLFNLFVAFEIMLLSSYALLCLGSTQKQMTHAYKYVILNLVGSTLFVLGAGLVYGMVGTLNYADLARIMAEVRLGERELPAAFQIVSIMLLLVFGLKAAIFPLWFWLPDTYHTMPTSITALFAALLSKVGVYAILRLYPSIFAAPGVGEHFFVPIIAVAAGATMLIAILGAVGSSEIRRLLSLVLISHVGFLIFGIVLMSPRGHAGTLFYMVQEMLVISALFLCCGMIEKHTGSDKLEAIGGVLKRAPWLAVLFFIGAMALVGIPPLSGFHGKVLMIWAGFEAGRWVLTGCLVLAAVLTLVAMLRVWSRAFWSPSRGAHAALERGAVLGTKPRLGWAFAGVVLLIGSSVGLGLGAEPVIQFTSAATSSLTAPKTYVTAVLGADAWPVEDTMHAEVDEEAGLIEEVALR